MAFTKPIGKQLQHDEQKNQDPWGGNNKKSEGPPDLDEVFRQLKRKLNKMFNKPNGNHQQSNNSGSSSDKPTKSANFDGKWIVISIIALIVIFWLIAGFFIVAPAEQAVVLRFGKYEQTLGPGPHWVPRFIDDYFLVNEQRVASYSYSSDMLTMDENIVSVSVAVQYRIQNAMQYLFSVRNPILSLQEATASAMRQVIGNSDLNSVLTKGREQTRQEVAQQLNTILARYNTGLLITDVSLQPISAPEAVKPAFDDAIKAQEDEKRYQDQAQADAAKVTLHAQGQAQRIINQAKAYGQQIILQAKANTAEFDALLPKFKAAPVVTRERMYLTTLESVFNHSTKIMLDAGKNSNNMLYLPLDKIIHQMTGKQQSIPLSTAASESEQSVDEPQTQTSTNTNSTSSRTRISRSEYYRQIAGRQGGL